MGKPFTALSVSRTSIFVELPDYLEGACRSRPIITVSEYFNGRAFIRLFPGHSLLLIISYYHNDYRESHTAIATVHYAATSTNPC